MREVVTAERIDQVMAALGQAAEQETRIYFAGGVTAVLMGWRASTVDIDLVVVPDTSSVLREIPALKERLHVNVELASPGHFIPVPPGWEERSTFIARHGLVSFYHYDLYAQALSKIERRHERDRTDVREMIRRGLVEPAKGREYFARIEPELYRFPAIDPPSFARAVADELGPPSA